VGLAPNQSRPLSCEVGEKVRDNLDRTTDESAMSLLTSRITQHSPSGQLDESVENGIGDRIKQRRIAVVIPEHYPGLEGFVNLDSEIKFSVLWH
jgi:hypothetical protein